MTAREAFVEEKKTEGMATQYLMAMRHPQGSETLRYGDAISQSMETRHPKVWHQLKKQQFKTFEKAVAEL